LSVLNAQHPIVSNKRIIYKDLLNDDLKQKCLQADLNAYGFKSEKGDGVLHLNEMLRYVNQQNQAGEYEFGRLVQEVRDLLGISQVFVAAQSEPIEVYINNKIFADSTLSIGVTKHGYLFVKMISDAANPLTTIKKKIGQASTHTYLINKDNPGRLYHAYEDISINAIDLRTFPLEHSYSLRDHILTLVMLAKKTTQNSTEYDVLSVWLEDLGALWDPKTKNLTSTPAD